MQWYPISLRYLNAMVSDFLELRYLNVPFYRIFLNMRNNQDAKLKIRGVEKINFGSYMTQLTDLKESRGTTSK